MFRRRTRTRTGGEAAFYYLLAVFNRDPDAQAYPDSVVPGITRAITSDNMETSVNDLVKEWKRERDDAKDITALAEKGFGCK